MTVEHRGNSPLPRLNAPGMPNGLCAPSVGAGANVQSALGEILSVKASAAGAAAVSAPSPAGVKYDAGKAPLVQACLHYFPRALSAVAEISAYGAKKYKVPYSDKNWMKLEDARNRYTDADGRHLVNEAIDGLYDPESGLLHAAHHAWDANARLELMLAEGVPLRKP